MKYTLKKIPQILAIVFFLLFVAPSIAKTEDWTSQMPDLMPKFPVSADRQPVRTLKVFATAYSSDPNQTDSTPCIPAIDFNLCEYFEKYGIEDTIAANFLTLGTKVRFPELYGSKIFVVRDRMNSRYNYERIGYYRIDFYKAAGDDFGNLDTKAAKQEAIEFGFKKNIKMEVIGV